MKLYMLGASLAATFVAWTDSFLLGVPTGSTIDMEVPPPGAKVETKQEPPKKKEEVDTSKSAAAILEKYRRRPRQ